MGGAPGDCNSRSLRDDNQKGKSKSNSRSLRDDNKKGKSNRNRNRAQIRFAGYFLPKTSPMRRIWAPTPRSFSSKCS
jgi:hypothetical protein